MSFVLVKVWGFTYYAFGFAFLFLFCFDGRVHISSEKAPGLKSNQNKNDFRKN